MEGGRGAVDCNLLNPTHGSTPITNIVIIMLKPAKVIAVWKMTEI